MLDDLLYVLDVFQFEKSITFKEAELSTNNSIEKVDILYSNSEYETSGLTEIEYSALSSKAISINTPNKTKGIAGIKITFKNENGVKWCKTFLSHKQEIYEQDDLLDNLQ